MCKNICTYLHDIHIIIIIRHIVTFKFIWHIALYCIVLNLDVSNWSSGPNLGSPAGSRQLQSHGTKLTVLWMRRFLKENKNKNSQQKRLISDSHGWIYVQMIEIAQFFYSSTRSITAPSLFAHQSKMSRVRCENRCVHTLDPNVRIPVTCCIWISSSRIELPLSRSWKKTSKSHEAWGLCVFVPF